MANEPAISSDQLGAVRDHTRRFEDFVFVYPVISRRSGGLSIGVNLNPDKNCNFNCIYCEVDRRTPGRELAPEPARIREELDAMIRHVKAGGLRQHARFAEAAHLATEIKDIAFSGDGEPTMVANFAACVDAVAGVKQAHGLAHTKIVLITDAAGLDKADVQAGLAIMDAHQGEIWGKLDAGTESYYRQVNRTHVRFERVLRNLLHTARVRPIVIQSLFLKVHGVAMPEGELDTYCDRLNAMVTQGARLKEVHAYTIARPTPEPYATRLNPAELTKVADRIRQRTGLPVREFV